jgi:hypothetical protein
MRHPILAATALAGGAIAAAPARAEPVRFDGLIDSGTEWFTPVDLTLSLAGQTGDFPGNSVFLLTHIVGGGSLEIGMQTSSNLPGSGVAQSILQSGDTIDGSLAWAHSGPNYASFLMAQGPNDGKSDPNFSVVDFGATGFVAVSFTLDDGVHYGWIEVINDSVAGSGWWRYDILAWGYETEAGVAIAAGAVPAPGAAGLLALAGLGVARRRR